MLERDWEKDCFAIEIDRLGHYFESCPDTGRRKFNSKPYDGQIIFKPSNVQCFVEIKIQNSPMKAHQERFAAMCQEHGLFHFTIRVFNDKIVALPYNQDIGKMTAENPKQLIEFIKLVIGG